MSYNILVCFQAGSRTLGWTQTLSVAEGDLELLPFLPPLPKSWHHRTGHIWCWVTELTALCTLSRHTLWTETLYKIIKTSLLIRFLWCWGLNPKPPTLGIPAEVPLHVRSQRNFPLGGSHHTGAQKFVLGSTLLWRWMLSPGLPGPLFQL